MGNALGLLAPAAVLALWTLVMLLWMAATRLPGMQKAMPQLKAAPPGGRGIDLEPLLSASTNWKSHNYTHLVEQPTVFYAVVLILFVGGGTTSMTVGLAWTYTGLRILHSLWQALINTIPVRFALFILSSGCLIALSVLAVLLTLG